MLNSNGFDLWADGYDKSVNISDNNNEYPFAGYKEVLNYILNQVKEFKNADVLDIGFGTGELTMQLYNAGCNITGIDFSKNMIDIAKQKMPNAVLINCDFSKELPYEVRSMRFDYIISTYAIHHLTDKDKVKFIKSLLALLNEKGRILIGDISFETRGQLEESKEKYKEHWDDDEIYFVGEEIKEAFINKYFCKYIKISHCAGVLTIENM